MSKKKVPHKFKGQFKHWFCCVKCGLMQLKNDASRRAILKPCDSDDHIDD